MTITETKPAPVVDFDATTMSLTELEEAINAYIGHAPMPQSLIDELEQRRARG